MDRLYEILFIFVIGGLISLSPVNIMAHELVHKLALNKIGVESKIVINYFYFKFEEFTLSFISDKKERKIDATIYPVLSKFKNCNKKQKIIVYLAPTIILSFINFLILLGYLILFKGQISNNFSILMIAIIFFEVLAGQQDFIDTYKVCVSE